MRFALAFVWAIGLIDGLFPWVLVATYDGWPWLAVGIASLLCLNIGLLGILIIGGDPYSPGGQGRE